MRIAALAENGLTFSKNPFELDRYKKLRDVAAELFALLTDRPLHELKMELGREGGYVTPKVEVRGALIDEGDRLLMMREVADGRWSLPGGFADPLDLSLIHISEPTRLGMISYAVFCLKK